MTAGDAPYGGRCGFHGFVGETRERFHSCVPRRSRLRRGRFPNRPYNRNARRAAKGQPRRPFDLVGNNIETAARVSPPPRAAAKPVIPAKAGIRNRGARRQTGVPGQSMRGFRPRRAGTGRDLSLRDVRAAAGCGCGGEDNHRGLSLRLPQSPRAAASPARKRGPTVEWRVGDAFMRPARRSAGMRVSWFRRGGSGTARLGMVVHEREAVGAAPRAGWRARGMLLYTLPDARRREEGGRARTPGDGRTWRRAIPS